ncbi:hypothetical protein ACIRH0_13030 [Streptomyces sp. NPDC093675]|uniref:hypothetical protein n=1 Tax=Streptomyces sp. NPDC093675 TaxID=3366049 RepID=UPI00382BA5CB
MKATRISRQHLVSRVLLKQFTAAGQKNGDRQLPPVVGSRHFYWITSSRTFCLAVFGTLTALIMAAAVIVGLSSAVTAADRTAAQASSGQDPSSFFGISARLVCASPLDAANTAVQPGPLPTGHPVVAFDVTGDETWLGSPAGQ